MAATAKYTVVELLATTPLFDPIVTPLVVIPANLLLPLIAWLVAFADGQDVDRADGTYVPVAQ